MNIDEIPTIDIVDSTGSAQSEVPRGGHRTTAVVVAATATVAVAAGLLTALHARGVPAIQPPAVSVPAGAPGSMLTQEQVPSWLPSTSATVVGGSAGSLPRQQVPSWTPTTPTFGQTYREQVPAGS